jgi:hypothetical protein
MLLPIVRIIVVWPITVYREPASAALAAATRRLGQGRHVRIALLDQYPKCGHCGAHHHRGHAQIMELYGNAAP